MLTPELKAQWAALGDFAPTQALGRVAQTRWAIDGVLPQGAIAWMVAAPQSFKSFLALDMAACVARGAPWHGRETAPAAVLYVAAEGDDDLHIRRAAADIEAGEAGALAVIHHRPRIDEASGLASLLALAWRVAGIVFPTADCYVSHEQYLDDDELARFIELDEWDAAEHGGKPAPQDSWDYAGMVSRHRFSAWDVAIFAVREAVSGSGLMYPHDLRHLMLVVDTYSQTSADDAKGTVSRFIKTLRDFQERLAAVGWVATILVIDHTTKAGDSFNGSIAKEGDCDSMIDVRRHGSSNAVTLTCAKLKAARPFEPMHFDLKPVTLEGFTDALGRLLTSLVVVDGAKAQAIRKTAGAQSDTAAALVLALVADGECTEAELKDRFTQHPANVDKKAESTLRAFKRAFTRLEELGAIAFRDGVVTQLSDTTEGA